MWTMTEKPKVGQTLYSLNIGNAARHKKQELTPVVVTKVGRKYFTAGEGRRVTQYHLDSWREKSEYTPDSRLFVSRQAWEDEKEINRIGRKIYKSFPFGENRHKISLKNLRIIEQFLDEMEVDDD